jgi:hypothetical protein
MNMSMEYDDERGKTVVREGKKRTTATSSTTNTTWPGERSNPSIRSQKLVNNHLSSSTALHSPYPAVLIIIVIIATKLRHY